MPSWARNCSRSSAARRWRQVALSRHELRRYHRPIMPNVYLRQAGRAFASASALRRARCGPAGRRSCRGSRRRRFTARSGSTTTPPIELIWRECAIARRRASPAKSCCWQTKYSESDGMPFTDPGAHRIRSRVGADGSMTPLLASTRWPGPPVFKVPESRGIGGSPPAYARSTTTRKRRSRCVDPGAESPQETWLRLLLIGEAYRRPQTQIPGLRAPTVCGGTTSTWVGRICMLAVEYDGDHHRTDRRNLRLGDRAGRRTSAKSVGWSIRVAATRAIRPEVAAPGSAAPGTPDRVDSAN